MSDSFYNLLCAFGLTYVVISSTIFAPFRIRLARLHVLLDTFLYCAYCVGFWAGGAVSFGARPELTWSALYDAFNTGLLVMGAIALLRAPFPSFLLGAYEAEHETEEPDRSADGSDD